MSKIRTQPISIRLMEIPLPMIHFHRFVECIFLVNIFYADNHVLGGYLPLISPTAPKKHPFSPRFQSLCTTFQNVLFRSQRTQSLILLIQQDNP
jgi:hypothetical protein